MSEPIATLEEAPSTGEYLDEYEMPTNRLGSGTLTKTRPKPAFGIEDWDMVPDADWLLRLTGSLRTAELDDDDPQTSLDHRSRFTSASPRARSGMFSHTSAVRIVPTRGARFTTGLRRTFLMVLLAVLGTGLLAGAGYLLAETSWLSNLFSPAPTVVTPPAQTPGDSQPQQEVVQPQAPLPEIRDSRPPITQPAGSAQTQETGPAVPADIEESALAGTDALVLRERGMEAYKAGDYEGAVTLLEQSVVLNKDDPMAQYQLGMAYMSITGRDHAMDDAELAFRTATSLQPDWAAAYQMLAETFLRRGFYNEAISPAEQATNLDPTMAEAWLTLGRAYTGAGMESEATQAYAEAARYAPDPTQP